MTDAQRIDVQPDDAEPSMDITFASSSSDSHSPVAYSQLMRAPLPEVPAPWYIRSDASVRPALPEPWQPFGGTPSEIAEPSGDLEVALLAIEPEADVAIAETPVPWFIRVDPPKPSLVGGLPLEAVALAAASADATTPGAVSAPLALERMDAPAALQEALSRAAAAARKRAVSFRTRRRADAPDAIADIVLPKTASPMSISVLGCGPSGLALASSFALSGHSVVVVTQDDDTLIALETGEEHYPEPQLHHLHTSARATGGLRVSADPRALSGATVTVLLDAGDEEAITALLPSLGLGSLVVVTAPVAAGMRRLERRIRPTGAELAWVPLLVRDGRIVTDLLRPRGIVFGLPRDPLTAADVRGALTDAYAFVLGAEPEPWDEAGAPASVVDVDFATADLARAAGVTLLLAALDAD